MSKADQIFINNMKDIMENGFWDTDLKVRPHWEDGTPAHTVKKFCIVNRYNLQEELPILTIRRTAFKSCLDELLWIWQKKSNNIHGTRGRMKMDLLVKPMATNSLKSPFIQKVNSTKSIEFYLI